MIEELIRHELPIQCLEDKSNACYTIIPIHLSVRQLPDIEKVDLKVLKGAKETVARWFNEDMEYLLDSLSNRGIDFANLRGYERFDDSWRLNIASAKKGFLTLVWAEKKTHLMSYIWMPLGLYNNKDEEGNFCSYELLRDRGDAEVLRKISSDPEIVFFTPEKMLRYGKKTFLAGFDPESGEIEVAAKCLASGYEHNIAHALLLRAYGVFYHNRLLKIAEKRSVIR